MPPPNQAFNLTAPPPASSQVNLCVDAREMSKSNAWTPSRRKAQSQRIHQWQPWTNATGPNTAAGKSIASRNADKGGTRPMLRELGKLLRDQRHSLAEISS